MEIDNATCMRLKVLTKLSGKADSDKPSLHTVNLGQSLRTGTRRIGLAIDSEFIEQKCF